MMRAAGNSIKAAQLIVPAAATREEGHQSAVPTSEPMRSKGSRRARLRQRCGRIEVAQRFHTDGDKHARQSESRSDDFWAVTRCAP